MKDIIEYTEFLVKSLCREPDLVKVESFPLEEGELMIEVIVHNSDMANVIGRNGKMISAIKTLIQAHSSLNSQQKVKVNVDSF